MCFFANLPKMRLRSPDSFASSRTSDISPFFFFSTLNCTAIFIVIIIKLFLIHVFFFLFFVSNIIAVDSFYLHRHCKDTTRIEDRMHVFNIRNILTLFLTLLLAFLWFMMSDISICLNCYCIMFTMQRYRFYPNTPNF